MPETLEKLRTQLMNRIDTDDLLEVKKVNRYIKLLELDIQCDEAIKEDGVRIVIENGSQRFIKTHDLLNGKIKINAQLIQIEKTFNFVEGNLVPSPAAASTSVEDKASEYNASDLYE